MDKTLWNCVASNFIAPKTEENLFLHTLICKSHDRSHVPHICSNPKVHGWCEPRRKVGRMNVRCFCGYHVIFGTKEDAEPLIFAHTLAHARETSWFKQNKTTWRIVAVIRRVIGCNEIIDHLLGHGDKGIRRIE